MPPSLTATSPLPAIGGDAAMLCAYLGTDERQYQDYLDTSTGRMLQPVPGEGPYDIQVAPGRAPGLPLPPGDGRWAPATGQAPQSSERPSASEPAGGSTVTASASLTGSAAVSALPSLPHDSTPDGPAPHDQAAAEAAPNPEGDE